MEKIFRVIPLVLLAACNNNVTSSDIPSQEVASTQQEATAAKHPSCVKGPFKNKEELIQLLVSRVYGKSQDVALQVLGRPDSVRDFGDGLQNWHYSPPSFYCSTPDEITGKPTVIKDYVITVNNKFVQVAAQPLTAITVRTVQ